MSLGKWLEIALIFFIAICIFGIGLMFYSVRLVLLRKDPLRYIPTFKKPHNSALDLVKELYDSMRGALNKVQPNLKTLFLNDMDLVSRLIEETKSRAEQHHLQYYRLLGDRERALAQLQKYVNQLSFGKKYFGLKKDSTYQQWVNFLRNLDDKIQDEYDRVYAASEIYANEVRCQGVFKRNAQYLPSFSQKTSSVANNNEDITAQEADAEANTNEDNQAEAALTDATVEGGFNEAPVKNKSSAPANSNVSSNNLSIKVAAEVAKGGQNLKQSDFPRVGSDISGSAYVDPTFSLDFADNRCLKDWNFSSCRFANVLLIGQHRYQHCNFSASRWRQAKWSAVSQPHRFEYCDFAEADLHHSSWQTVGFFYCRFDGANLRGVEWQGVKFVDCTFEGVDLNGLDFHDVIISPGTLQKYNFQNCAKPPKNFQLSLQPADIPPETAQIGASKSPTQTGIGGKIQKPSLEQNPVKTTSPQLTANKTNLAAADKPSSTQVNRPKTKLQ